MSSFSVFKLYIPKENFKDMRNGFKTFKIKFAIKLSYVKSVHSMINVTLVPVLNESFFEIATLTYLCTHVCPESGMLWEML